MKSCKYTHAIPADDKDAALKPVMWGELPDEDYGDTDGREEGLISDNGTSPPRYRHCAFTSQKVFAPRANNLYA